MSDSAVSPVPPMPLPGCYLGLQPLRRAQELGTAPAHLGHGLQQPPARPRAHAKGETPAGEPGDGKPWLGLGLGAGKTSREPFSRMGRGV